MRPLTLDALNPQLQTVQYAVRGELAIRAETLREQLKQPNNGLPFEQVISSNIGDPQQKGLDQKPITFTRQVAALMEWPALAELAPDVFPPDVVARAKELQEEIGSIGAYSDSQGVPLIRKSVANFIAERDGHPASPGDIFLTAGACAGVSLLLNLLITAPTDGILIPIPQYPLYTATLAQHHGTPVGYLLNEADGWSTDPESIRAALAKAAAEGVQIKALVVINPGNPTGALLAEDTMRTLVTLCEEHSLVLLADEVYQDNVHDRTQHTFVSFKKVVRDMRSPVPLVSFHSISKGVSGECGRRGGYFELANFADGVRALVYKLVCVCLAAPVSGQIGLDTMVGPPRVGDASYALWREETRAIHAALAERTRAMADALNRLPGVRCVQSPGALYLFPQITLPATAVASAREAGKEPDAVYAMGLLEATGICVVPGSGFGQKEGEWHYRLTCLCPGTDEYVGKLVQFHIQYLAEWEKA
ncbi:1-aminocyclopropane-1-carboxylate synthase 2 [Mycena maculata]|uniref:1-aminocyclopropane-1-carboxylate synthase 2 n=1 Tax=Mycena maculata TaxID=230809 RepID=A0AAD7N419_9AGAR|nr:1-aminocyclopropane-1-carboxylate synthase 2 [Mycena maculata]